MATPLVLKIDVDTLRGTQEGVPRLVDCLRRHRAGATFLFSLGPDHTGRAMKRAFRPGFLQKVGRTSVLEHYGIRTLMYGVLLPGPDIGRRAAAEMRAVRDAGFEVGIHCWDHVQWQDGVRDAGDDWTVDGLTRAAERFREIFGADARVHGAAGWQMNRRALAELGKAGIAVSSDCRGRHPFRPTWNGELLPGIQLPTTLPTLDELIGIDGTTVDNVAAQLLARSARAVERPQVFTLHAELEGQKLLPVFEELLAGWRAQGFAPCSMSELAATLEVATLPRCPLEWGGVPGRSGQLLLQGERAERGAGPAA